MNKFLFTFTIIFLLVSCSNTPELETGEIKTLQMLKSAINQSRKPKKFTNARQLLNREQINAANIPVLFVELESGQNGTLTPYPGKGVGQTWLGADGATITFEQGVLKASRGMGNDLMGVVSSMPKWDKLENNGKSYVRQVSHLAGNNQLNKGILECTIQKMNKKEIIKIWDVKFRVTKFEESCNQNGTSINNVYFVDDKRIVRRSFQYHSETLGYIVTERLDQLSN